MPGSPSFEEEQGKARLRRYQPNSLPPGLQSADEADYSYVVPESIALAELGDEHASSAEGFMDKKGHHPGAGYNRRYFRLEKEKKKLRYYVSPSDAEPKGSINLSTVTDPDAVCFSEEKDEKLAVGVRVIQIVTADRRGARTYQLRCESTLTAQRWIDDLRQAITTTASDDGGDKLGPLPNLLDPSNRSRLVMRQLSNISEGHAVAKKENARAKRKRFSQEALENGNLVDPEGQFRKRWDFTQIILLTYVAFIIPWRLGCRFTSTLSLSLSLSLSLCLCL